MKEFITSFEQQSNENTADVIIVNGEAFTYKNTGLTRRVFVNGAKTQVVKVPVDKRGQHFNDTELEEYLQASEAKKKQLAVTQMLPNGYIIQEFLHTLDDDATEEWLGRDLTMAEIDFARRCREDVGFDEEGNLKCYDVHEYLKY